MQKDCGQSLFINLFSFWNRWRIIPKRGFKMPYKDREDKKKNNQEYAGKVDEIKVRLPKGDAEKYKLHAKELGQSLNSFVVQAMEDALERDISRK